MKNNLKKLNKNALKKFQKFNAKNEIKMKVDELKWWKVLKGTW